MYCSANVPYIVCTIIHFRLRYYKMPHSTYCCVYILSIYCIWALCVARCCCFQYINMLHYIAATIFRGFYMYTIYLIYLTPDFSFLLHSFDLFMLDVIQCASSVTFFGYCFLAVATSYQAKHMADVYWGMRLFLLTFFFLLYFPCYIFYIYNRKNVSQINILFFSTMFAIFPQVQT